MKSLYDKEQRNQRKGEGTRSEELTRRMNDALKAFNQFNAEETEEPATNEERLLRLPLRFAATRSTSI